MSLVFNAANDELIRTANLPPIATFTMMAWVKLNDLTRTTDSCIFKFGQAGSTVFMYMLGTSSDGISFGLFNDNSGPVTSATRDFDATNWVHIAMTVSGTGASTFLAYWNGVLEMTSNGDTNATNAEMRIGENGQLEFWNGKIAGIKVYSAALNATEVATERNSWAPVRTANINGYYPCTDASVATCVLDSSGTGFNWVPGGTLTTSVDNPALAASGALQPQVLELLGVGDTRSTPA